MNKRQEIIQIIESVSGKPFKLSPEESLFESGTLDSFALTDVVAALEKKFKVSIPDSALNPRKFDSVERIEEHLAEWGK